MHDHKTTLSLDVVKSQQRNSTQVAAVAFDTVDVRKEVKELNAKVTDLDGHVATIRSKFLDFRAKAKENHLNLSTQLGFLVDYIRRGDGKKGEGGSSRPQPPPDDQSRPSGGSGNRADDPRKYGGGSLLVSIQLFDISDVEAFSRYNQMLQNIQQLGIYFRSECIHQLGIYFSSEYFQTLATVAFDSIVTI
ncbi:hypothetical protein F511_13762 [Dorcoceras hygrometricum]|uniref:Uncharacterized protein n=1 Tax=Dorcoceras hygrometricum TaxID=472368 RepID=A0A2Z7CN44_9LAMI|nr:hypothetical protein F511_13762 [Dorcoceras hygrometricum]